MSQKHDRQDMQVVKFDLLGQRRLEFGPDAVRHITKELYPVPLPGHLGAAAITTNRAIRYEDIRWIGPIRRRQWWALVVGGSCGALGIFWMIANRAETGPLVAALVFFLLVGVLPLWIFLRGRCYLAVAGQNEVICFPADRKKRQVRRALELLRVRCLPGMVHWEPLPGVDVPPPASGHTVEASLIWLAAALCSPGVLGAGGEADWRGARAEAKAFEKQGDRTAAIKSLERAAELARNVLGPNHANTALSLNDLALAYKAKGEHAQAEALFQRSLGVYEAAIGADHLNVAIVSKNLADLYAAMGQFDKAEPIYQRSLKIWEARLGPEHLSVAKSLHNLAAVHAATERWAEAIAQTERSRRIVRRQVVCTLPMLSEREQLMFLRANDAKQLQSALSLGFHHQAHAEIAPRSAGWVLNGKAVAQEVLAQQATAKRRRRRSHLRLPGRPGRLDRVGR